jgi:O-antigen/teichoic acid export membrane protein
MDWLVCLRCCRQDCWIARYTGGQRTTRSIRTLLFSAEILTLAIAITIGSLLALCAPWISERWIRTEHLDVADTIHAIEAMGVLLGLRLFEGLYRGCLQGLQRLVLLNLLSAAVATLRWGGVAIVLVWVDSSVTAFFVWQCAASIAATLIYAWATKRSVPFTTPSPRFSADSLISVRPFFSAILATYALSFAVSHTDKLVLSKTITLNAFGHYAVATLIASTLLMIASPISQVFYPRLTVLASRDDHAQLAASYHLGTQLQTVLLTPPALILMAFGPQLLLAWTGDPVLAIEAGSTLQVLALGTLLNGYMGMPHMLQLAKGWPALSARSNLFAATLLIPAVLMIAPEYGGIGTAWIWVVLNASYVAIVIPIMHRHLLTQEMWVWYWQDILIPGGAALAPVIISYLIYPTTASIIQTWVWLVCTGILSMACAAVCSRETRKRAKALLRSFS